MDIDKFLKIDINCLLEHQEKALVEYVYNKLNIVAEQFKDGFYKEIPVNYSPAGDECGGDNRFLDFSELGLGPEGITDIGDIIDKLILLQDMKKKKNK